MVHSSHTPWSPGCYITGPGDHGEGHKFSKARLLRDRDTAIENGKLAYVQHISLILEVIKETDKIILNMLGENEHEDK